MKNQISLKLICMAVFSIGFLSTHITHATVKIIPAISVEKQIPAWNQAYSETMRDLIAGDKVPANGYMECAPTKELPNAVLCLSYKQKDMNLAFNRITRYVEGFDGLPKGEVVRHDSLLGNMVSTYRPKLLKKLAEKKLAPLLVP